MRIALLLPALLFFAGCSGSRFALPDVERLPDAAFVRPSDGLLERPDLQAVVDLQVLRQGLELLPYLIHPDAAIRARAAFALGSVQYEGAVPELLNLLSDSSPNVRADAAFAIGQTADSTAAPTLLDALRQETDAIVQAEILAALGRIGDEPALLDLLAIDLPETVESVRHLAIARFGLRGIHHPDAVAHLLRNAGHRMDESSAYYFGRMRDPAPWLPEAGAVRAAFDAAYNRNPGDPALMHLARALGRTAGTDADDEEIDAERMAFLIAGGLRFVDPPNEEPIRHYTPGRGDASPDWRVRQAAVAALGSLSNARSASLGIRGALEDANANVAVTAAGVLSGIDRPAPHPGYGTTEWIADSNFRPVVVAALMPMLVQDGRVDDVMAWLDAQDDPFMQAHGLAALGGAQDGASLDLLFDRADEANTRIAYAALEALKERWKATRETADAARFYSTFAAGVARRDLATTSASASILTDSLFAPFDPGSELRAVYQQMEAPRDLEPMVEIVKALGEIRDGQEIDFLVDVVMQAGHPVLRQAAVEALDGRLEEGIDVETRGETVMSTVLIDWDQLGEYGPRPLLTLFTAHGPIVIEMDAEQAPQTVQKIIRTAVLGEYDGVPFHRVVANFVIQGGDHFREDGFGGPDVAIRSEFTRIRFSTGTAGIASSGKDTEGVQYFVTHSVQPHLDGRYTAFGRVIHGQEVVDVIQQGDAVMRVVVGRDE